jgi:YHS domain-containing protein
MKNSTRNILVILALSISALALSCSTTGGVARINTRSDGLAVQGHDPVAYFTSGAPVAGDPKFEYAWNGAKWLFASAENLEKFKKDPEAFAPQFGGYCAYAVSHGHTADGDPQAWKIVNGKLYLNYSPDVKKMWEADQETFIKDGEKNWPEFLAKKP